MYFFGDFLQFFSGISKSKIAARGNPVVALSKSKFETVASVKAPDPKEAFSQPHVAQSNRLSQSSIYDSFNGSALNRPSNNPFSWKIGTIPSALKDLVGVTHCDRDLIPKNNPRAGWCTGRFLAVLKFK